jgi:DNA polymerase-4
MDAFFANVEIRENPSLKNKPVVIAKHPRLTGGRGVVSTCNYIAREYGIHSAMSAQMAYKLCPKAVFISGNYDLYIEISHKIREIFHRYTDIVEPISIDEAYLDVTENKIQSKSAVKIARCIQKDIFEELSLTCSAGVSFNKFLAKIASDIEKPRGLTIITPVESDEFLASLPIEKFFGVGKKTVEKLHELGIYKGSDLRKRSELELIERFGKMGYSLFRKSRGIHNSPVVPNRERKSIGKESTFSSPLLSEEQVLQQLERLSERVADRLNFDHQRGYVVTVKIRYADFYTITRRITLENPTARSSEIYHHGKVLLEGELSIEKGIRLMGISVSDLTRETIEKIKLSI